MPIRSALTVAVAALLLAGPAALAGQETPPSTARRVSVIFDATPMRDVAGFFARFADRSIVVGPDVGGIVTATIEDQPWDVALAAILRAYGLRGTELPSGILVVDALRAEPENYEVLTTRVFRLNYVDAEEMRGVVETVLSPRGSVSVLPSANALVVTDVESVLERIGGVTGG